MIADTPNNVSTTANMTARYAITTTELLAATNAPKDVASPDTDALHTQRLQAVRQFRDYSTQDYNVAGTHTGPLPRAALCLCDTGQIF